MIESLPKFATTSVMPSFEIASAGGARRYRNLFVDRNRPTARRAEAQTEAVAKAIGELAASPHSPVLALRVKMWTLSIGTAGHVKSQSGWIEDDPAVGASRQDLSGDRQVKRICDRHDLLQDGVDVVRS